jgi:hypothetical protein
MACLVADGKRILNKERLSSEAVSNDEIRMTNSESNPRRE